MDTPDKHRGVGSGDKHRGMGSGDKHRGVVQEISTEVRVTNSYLICLNLPKPSLFPLATHG